MRTCLVASLFTVAAIGSPAAAQPSSSETDDERSPGSAVALSLGATLVSTGLIAGSISLGRGDVSTTMAITGLIGLTVGPSLGHSYGRDKLITAGLGVRLAGAGLVTVGVLEGLSHVTFGLGDPKDDSEDSESSSGTGLIMLGALVFISGTIYDIATAGSHTARANDARRTARLQLTPSVVRTPNGVSAGVGLGGTF